MKATRLTTRFIARSCPASSATSPGVTVGVVALSVAFGVAADLAWVYHASAAVLGVAFIAGALNVRRDDSARSAMRLFTFSITYITLLFGAMAADALVWGS